MSIVPTALTVAGSDPSGGAGLQADLKTFQAHGVYGMAAVTAITVQNTLGVSAVHPIAPELLRDQVASVLADLPVHAVKIGMIGSAQGAAAIAEALRPFSGPIILDPIFTATGGTELTPPAALSQLQTHLLPLAELVTPNGPEALRLMADEPPAAWAARTDTSVLITGGHADTSDIVDRLFLPSGAHHSWTHPRIESRNTHGTGCTISAAIAAQRAVGLDLVEAVDKAIAYTSALLERSAGSTLGHGSGPLLHGLD